MPRLKSGLFELIESAMEGKLARVRAEWDRRAALGVVLAAPGYPDTPKKGDVVTGLPTAGEEFRVFHSGTVLKDGATVNRGGGVVCVAGFGESIKLWQLRAHEVPVSIRFVGV